MKNNVNSRMESLIFGESEWLWIIWILKYRYYYDTMSTRIE